MNRDEQVLKNLDLLEGFLHHVIDHPQMMSGRDGATIVLVPDYDPELADANIAAARELMHRCPRCGSHVQPTGDELKVERSGGVYLQPV